MDDNILQDIKLPEPTNGKVLEMHDINTRLEKIYCMFGSNRYQEAGKCAQLLTDDLKKVRKISGYIKKTKSSKDSKRENQGNVYKSSQVS